MKKNKSINSTKILHGNKCLVNKSLSVEPVFLMNSITDSSSKSKNGNVPIPSEHAVILAKKSVDENHL